MVSIFLQEIKDGISEKVKANNTVAFTSSIKLDDIKINEDKLITIASKLNKDQKDLFYLKSILVSSGWNKNDDIFDRKELWDAKYTPIDKPFNYEHNENDIIGHMTDSIPVDESYALINDDTIIDDLPDKFHLLTMAVLYKYWSDEKLQARMNQIIEEINKNEWFVSMETLFRGFDYGIVDSQGNHRVVARNEQTSFLTKHLRIYGGTGKYSGYKVGRFLRNLTFCAKGLVKNPANPDSIIIVDNFKSVSYNDLFGVYNSDINGDSIMQEDKNKSVANVDNEELTNALAEIKKLQETINKLQEDNKSLSTEIAEYTNQNSVSLHEIEIRQKEIGALNDQLKTRDETIDNLNKEIKTIKDNEYRRVRIEAATKAGIIKDNEQKTIDFVCSLNDDQFDQVVSLAALIKVDEVKVDSDSADQIVDKIDLDKATITNNDPVHVDSNSEELVSAISNYIKPKKNKR